MAKDFNTSKPEWFQLVNSDAPSAQVRKIDKKLPAVAAVVAGTIIAMGSFFAQATEESQSNSQVLASTQSASTQADSVEVQASTTTSSPKIANTPIATSAPVAQQKIQAPTGGGGEDDDDDEDDDEDKDANDHDREDRDRH
jgi:hypothetical protein